AYLMSERSGGEVTVGPSYRMKGNPISIVTVALAPPVTGLQWGMKYSAVLFSSVGLLKKASYSGAKRCSKNGSSCGAAAQAALWHGVALGAHVSVSGSKMLTLYWPLLLFMLLPPTNTDRKSTRLNSS